MPTDHKKFLWVSILVVIGLLMVSAGFYAAFHPTMESSSTLDSSNTSEDGNADQNGVASSPTSPNVTLAEINNGTYTVWSNTETIALKNGLYQDNSAHISSSLVKYALGDINNDGTVDALVAITTSRGDSMDELFAVYKQNGKIVTTSFLNIPVGQGNSVRNINSVAIDSRGVITLNLSVLAPNDPRSAPSMQGVYHFKFDGKHLLST